MSYNNPTPVAVGIMPFRNKKFGVLVIRRGIQPKLGEWTFPGGFVNEGESAEVAVAREIDEEIGVITQPEDWKVLCTKVTPGNQLLIFLVLQDGLDDFATFTLTEEATDTKSAFADDVLGFPLHTEALCEYFLEQE